MTRIRLVAVVEEGGVEIWRSLPRTVCAAALPRPLAIEAAEHLNEVIVEQLHVAIEDAAQEMGVEIKRVEECR